MYMIDQKSILFYKNEVKGYGSPIQCSKSDCRKADCRVTAPSVVLWVMVYSDCCTKMACFPKNVYMMCMGKFDGCQYIDGQKIVLTILSDSVSNLRHLINHELPSEWMLAHYELYYIAKNWMGARKKHELASDADLLRLCDKHSEPVVYVDHDDLPGEPEQEVYVPSFDYPQSSGVGYDTQSILPMDERLEAIQRYSAAVGIVAAT